MYGHETASANLICSRSPHNWALAASVPARFVVCSPTHSRGCHLFSFKSELACLFSHTTSNLQPQPFLLHTTTSLYLHILNQTLHRTAQNQNAHQSYRPLYPRRHRHLRARGSSVRHHRRLRRQGHRASLQALDRSRRYDRVQARFGDPRPRLGQPDFDG